jgi:hypothetical protein
LEKTGGDLTSFMELLPGHKVEFGMSMISFGHVHEMQHLGYFGSSVGRSPGAEEVPEQEIQLVVFEAFFSAGLRLLAHQFISEVLKRCEVQLHQLTMNVMVVLAKFIWVEATYGVSPR